MKLGSCVFCLLIAWGSAHAQRYTVEKSTVSFFREASVEDIAATNTKATGTLDPHSNELAFDVPVEEFQFKKSLMKQHFNEKYLESSTYPTATFRGRISGFSESMTGEQRVKATGLLTIHGVSREVTLEGRCTSTGDGLKLTAKFLVRLEDYRVRIPTLFWKTVAESVDVTVEFTLRR